MMFFSFLFPFISVIGAKKKVPTSLLSPLKMKQLELCKLVCTCVYLCMDRASRVESGEGEDSRPNIPAVRLTMHSVKLLQNSKD